MAFDVSGGLNEIRIRDQRDPHSYCSLFARDPNPREQLAYAQEALVQKGGKVVNNVRRTRLKWGCLVAERPQPAADQHADGYGYWEEFAEEGGKQARWVPLTAEAKDLPVQVQALQTEYAALHGSEWARWIGELPAWKVLLLARCPMHFEAVAGVLFEGVAEAMAAAEEGAGNPN